MILQSQLFNFRDYLVELHPIHRAYLSKVVWADLDTLFALFDALGDMKTLSEALSLVYWNVIDPHVAEPVSVHDRLGDRIEGVISHSRFKEKAKFLASCGGKEILVSGIVHQALCYILGRAEADVERLQNKNEVLIANLRRELAGELPAWKRTQTEDLISKTEKHNAELPQMVEQFRAFYSRFCEIVLAGLIEADRVRGEQAMEAFCRKVEGRQLSEEEFPGAPKEMPGA